MSSAPSLETLSQLAPDLTPEQISEMWVILDRQLQASRYGRL